MVSKILNIITRKLGTFIIYSILSTILISNAQSNQIIENFTLLDHTGKSHELYYYSDKKAIVLISQGNGCPIARHSIPTLNQLKTEFEPQGVTFLMINANLQDERFSIVEEAREFNISIPILEDRTQIIAESLNITRTAEALLIDPSDWSIRYRGAIDDHLGYETQKKQATRRYLKDAIIGLLDGKDITTPTTAVKGCLINFEHKTKASTYTYNKHVAPILEAKCLKCHTRGGAAPWAMNDYQTVKGWGPMIREVIRTKRMPPFKPDPYYGRFKNDNSLTPEEIRTIIYWIEQGFLKVEEIDYLNQIPKTEPEDWPLGEPDIILTVKENQIIPATGILPYRYIDADKKIDEDIWIRAIHMKPSNSKILHHGTILVQPPEVINKGMPNEQKTMLIREEEKKLVTGFTLRKQDYTLTGYKPGSEPFLFPENTGIFFPKGTKIVFILHYTTSGKSERDTTKIGLYLHKKRPSDYFHAMPIRTQKFDIPAGAKEYQVITSDIIQDDILLYTVIPHMHYRGKSIKITAKSPDAASDTLLSVPAYNFYWQHAYHFKEPKIIPAGTTIECAGVFDNSVQNPLNPDPTRKVEWGLQSTDEMMRCILWYSKQKN